MTIQPVDTIWMNGSLVPWAEATVHVLTHGLHYGTGVFEGARCYDTRRGPAVFRLPEHLRRMHRSARVAGMDLPYSVQELEDAVLEVIRVNGLSPCYVRPIAYRGYGGLGLNPTALPVDVAIAAWPWGTYLGADALETGVSMTISSWRRNDPNTIPPDSKLTGAYLTSCLATTEANHAGFAEALMLNSAGFVAEGAGENLFIVEEGKVITPPVAAGILPGITRDTAMQLARDLDFPVGERVLTRSEVYAADEAFCVGTAAEIVPIRAVDGRDFGPPGPVTKALQEKFFEIVAGTDEKYLDRWFTFVAHRRRSSGVSV